MRADIDCTQKKGFEASLFSSFRSFCRCGKNRSETVCSYVTCELDVRNRGRFGVDTRCKRHRKGKNPVRTRLRAWTSVPFPNPFLATGAPGSGTSATHAGAHAHEGVPDRVLPSFTRANARRVAKWALGSHTPAVYIYVPALRGITSRRLSRFSRRRRVCFLRDERARGGPHGLCPVQGGDDQVRMLRSPEARRPEGAVGTSARSFFPRAPLRRFQEASRAWC